MRERVKEVPISLVASPWYRPSQVVPLRVRQSSAISCSVVSIPKVLRIVAAAAAEQVCGVVCRQTGQTIDRGGGVHSLSHVGGRVGMKWKME